MSKELVVYYGEWDIYDRKFFIADIDPTVLTTVVYAFINVDSLGNLIFVDNYAETDIRFTIPGTFIGQPDSWNDSPQLPFYGNLNQLKKFKQINKNVRVEIGIGGWTCSKNMSSAMSVQNQQNFINSISNFLKKYPFFDGVVIDWEYPSSKGVNYGLQGNMSTPQDSTNFLNTIILLSKLTSVSACFTSDSNKLDFDPKPFAEYLNRFDVMTYDFSSGNWGDVVTAHNSNLRSTSYTKFSVENAVQLYLSKGIPSSKIMIGAVLYSRGFSNTDGPGTTASGGSLDKTWEDGVVDFKMLPVPGAIEYYDPLAGAAYTFDSNRRVLNSFDNVISAAEKALYVNKMGLRGIIVWEMSGDFISTNSNSVLNKLAQGLFKQDYTFTKNVSIQPGFFKNVSIPVSGLGTPTPNVTPIPNVTPTPIPNVTPVPNPNVTPTPIPNVTPVPNPNVTPTPIPNVTSNSNWSININYNVGDIVLYNNQSYKCINAHKSIESWSPGIYTTSLWTLLDKIPMTPLPTPTPVITIPVNDTVVTISIDTGIIKNLSSGQTSMQSIPVIGGKMVNISTQNFYTRLIFEFNQQDLLSIPENGVKILNATVSRKFK
jgi:chitinase